MAFSLGLFCIFAHAIRQNMPDFCTCDSSKYARFLRMHFASFLHIMHFVKICQFFAHGPMLSPKTPSPNKAHSLTIFNEHQKQKHDSTNDNSPCICSGRTLTRSNCIGASRNDGLSGFKSSSPLMKKPSNPDRVSTCESFTSNESRGTSTIPTGQPQRVAMVSRASTRTGG